MKPPSPWSKALRCAAALLLLAHAMPALPACPPTPQLPTPEQIVAGAQNARDRGYLWRVAKDGRTSYLYGTIHVGKFAWAFPGPTVSRALSESDTLALELDVTDPELAPGGPRSEAPALPPALRHRLERQLAAACVAHAGLAALHPVMQAVSLSVLAARWDGLDPTFAQEIVLGSFARAAGKPVVALETMAAQMAALIPSDDKTALALVEQTLTQLESNQVRPVLVRLAAAWAGGDLADLERYDRWCGCADSDEEREFMRRLNDGRNPALAERIDRLHRDGKRVFAAVGALHMTGPQALPLLLAQRGYTVERVKFTIR